MTQFRRLALLLVLLALFILQNGNKSFVGSKAAEASADQNKMAVIATGYCNGPICINVAKWRDGKTASNTKARRGVCAADWDVFSPGTRIWIPGYGECVVEDKGGAIKGNRIDLFFDTHQEAVEWGRQSIDVELLS